MDYYVTLFLANTALVIASAGGLFTLCNQFAKLTARWSVNRAKKQELQAQFAEFLKAREAEQAETSA
ncbi:hypothetical protein AHiyo8_59520 [Arthrobacter sp. Hiyo8]|uniref:hypothetical protein n=1 Tax=Arthrobacter sp. Hiyo1 TaxID=1588020 RepID=UPI0006838C6B|nr:hypothetical protein [Arthrobacter sp. Hiyo1]BAS17649.1 hypothetical protein AHiyo8_59520 [Arthrobacter sp. Hiyo8]GAP58005.1 hypothetical protein AHiyo1_09670 [Arthrobacter sp. Hiyo1]